MRVLVVEDEQAIAQALKKGLEQERYAVDLAYSGNEALTLAHGESYDLIVLDWMIPEPDGLAVCKELRAAGSTVPVLMLTAKYKVIDKVAGLDIGADDYLSKPFAFEELLARVRALLRRPAQSHGPMLTFADVQLSPADLVVSRAGKIIELSQKEFAVLDYFMRHPRKIMSKEQLMFHVWNYDADILPNTVEVTVKNLRQKLEKQFSHLPKLIHTVRGFGYKLDTDYT